MEMVDFVSALGLDAGDFFGKYLLWNKPCLIDGCMTSEWRARREWVKERQPDLEYLKSMFGDAVVPIADCNRSQYGAHPKEEMLFQDYLDYWKSVMRSDSECDCQTTRSLYLKDWHFTKSFPDYYAYYLPPHFSCDWLDEFWAKRQDTTDDYRFVYMGPKGTWTPFHADVYRSYSWSANICGSKRWLLFPPGEEEKLRDCYGSFPFDVRLAMSESKPITTPIEVIQNAGEVIFVPSGWFHQVENLEDTISINHNWANACNLEIMFDKLESDLKEVQLAIADCRDMDGWHKQCQTILLANSGMDYHEFINYIETIAHRVVGQLRDTLHCLRHHKQTKQKAEIVPSLTNLFTALASSDFSANRKLKLDESSVESLSELATSGGDYTLRLTLLRAFEAKQLGVVLHKIMQDGVLPGILDISEQAKMEKLVRTVDDVLINCCRYTSLPSHWFKLK